MPAAVTVVTARNGDGLPHGTTVSAFCSLSVNPPLVLVALDRSSDLLPLVERQRRFGMNVLAGGQEEVGTACARKGPDKLAGTSWRYDSGLPRIDDSAAWLACDVQDILGGGDHVIVVGLVTACEPGDAEPLVYHRRHFLRLPDGEGDPERSRGKEGGQLRIRRGEHKTSDEALRLKVAPVGIRPGLFFALVVLVALVAIVVTSPAPATPGVFSLDRLRLGSVTGPENYLYTAGNSIYPEGGIDAGAFYYKVVVTDTAGTVRNPAFPCTPSANFTTANNSYNVSPSDPVSNSVYWKFTLQQFANSSCTGTPAKSAFLQFDVAKLTSWADPALTTQKSVFAPGSSVYVTVAGMKPTQSNVSNTWLLPSSAAACGNTVGGDRANVDGFGRAPEHGRRLPPLRPRRVQRSPMEPGNELRRPLSGIRRRERRAVEPAN